MSDDMQHMNKKGEGTGSIVSGCMLLNIGFVSATAEQVLKAEENRRARIAANTDPNVKEVFRPIDMLHKDAAGLAWTFFMFEYGKNREGYWMGEKMVKHMTDVLDVLGVLYPEHSPVCFFDWSSCHDCMEVGAAAVSKMNVGVGGVRKGEQLTPMNRIQLLADTPKIRKGEWQNLTFQPGDAPPFYALHMEAADYVGRVKGMKQILWERGLFKPGMTKDGGKVKDPTLSMEYVLGNQPDFKAVPSSLQVLVERLGGRSLMLPKYHCELNPIELMWGMSKFLVRRVCDYTYEGLKRNIPASFRPPACAEESGMHRVTLQRYCRKIHTYHAIYNDTDATGIAADDVYKVYKSHRRPAPSEYINP